MKRQIPNLLSGIRLLAAAMGFLPAAGGAFAALYLFCGLTDVLDGWLARRLHAESEVGARLDSAADACFTAAVLFRLWPLVRAAVVRSHGSTCAPERGPAGKTPFWPVWLRPYLGK